MDPIIGITSRTLTVRSSAGESPAHTVNHAYSASVVAAGGIPLILPPVTNGSIGHLLDRVDGVVLTGGGDIDPARYGGTPHDSIYDVDHRRDEFELNVVHELRARRMPVLAICRGLQVVNVALGGSLVEDIPSKIGSVHHSVTGDGVYAGHQRVTIKEGSKVGAALGAHELMVNSIHHQAARTLGAGLRAVAWADDGVIEGIEHDDDRWPLLAVQWHPEYLHDRDDAALGLFRALVAAGRDSRVEAATIG